MDSWPLSELEVPAYLLSMSEGLRFDSVRLTGSTVCHVSTEGCTLRDLSCDNFRGKIRILFRLISRISREVKANN